MAGDWIPLQTSLWDCPQVVRILSAMCPQLCAEKSAVVRTKCEIIGALYRTWSIFDTHSEDGKLIGYTADALNHMVGIDGWSENLQHVGWLLIEQQVLVMPEFETWLGQSAKRRAKEARRKRNGRKTVSAKRPQNVRIDADKMRTTEEKRREEKNTPLPPLPSVLDCDEFRDAWKDWLHHRSEIRKPVKSTQAESMLKQMGVWGVSRSVDAIRHTITMGWVGIREPESNGRTKTNGDSRPVLHSADVAKELAKDWRP